MTLILTHRGLEPASLHQFAESSPEAFCSQLDRGFGLEFDPCFLKDGEILITHSAAGNDGTPFVDLTRAEIVCQMGDLPKLFFLDQLLEKISKSAAPLHAVHLKGKFQNKRCLEIFVSHILKWPKLHSRLMVFDLKIDAAEIIRAALPQVKLAPSVAHPFDVSRYNDCVAGTLLTIDEVAKHKALFDWVWLDEWDLAGPGGSAKTFYSREVFEQIRVLGLKIGLVTPELHATSPGLLGGESHPDAQSTDRLFERCRAICKLNPDAICTDYPEELKRLIAAS